MAQLARIGKCFNFISPGTRSSWLHAVEGALFFLCLSSALWAQDGPRLAYRHYLGQRYRIVSQVEQQVFRNRRLVYNTTILNRIAIRVAQILGSDALLDVVYQVSEEAENGKFFSFAQESTASFLLSPQGLYKSFPSGGSANLSLPSLRHVPSFPSRELKPGEGWSAPGTEFQDLSQVFGIPVTLRFDFTVDYMYRGTKLLRGRQLQHITLFYTIDKDLRGQLSPYKAGTTGVKDIPRSLRARHSIELYWDDKRGLPVFQQEDFVVSYLLQNGDEIKFKGRSRGNIVEAQPMQRDNLNRNLQQDLRRAGIAAVVRQDDKGVSISLDSINFYPNSDRMLPGEERQLQHISDILQKYAHRDILVTGHTADLGQPEQQQKLSQSRAATVGQFFIANKIRRREQIVIRGVGATQPVASNNSERGRKQNRRVEITLLEN